MYLSGRPCLEKRGGPSRTDTPEVRFRVHNSLRDFLAKELRRAGVSPVYSEYSLDDEKHLATAERRRMDLVVRHSQFAHKTQAFDITVAAPFSTSYRSAASKEAGATATLAERPKFDHYKDLLESEGMEFTAIGLGSCGALGRGARKALLHIGKFLAETRGSNPSDETDSLTTRLVSHLLKRQAFVVNRRRFHQASGSVNVAS